MFTLRPIQTNSWRFSSKSPSAHFVQSTSCSLLQDGKRLVFDVYLFVCVEARRSDRNAPEGERRSWRRAPPRSVTSLPSLARARDLSCLSSDIFLLHVVRFANSPRALRWLCTTAAAAVCGAEKDISTFRAPWLLRVCVRRARLHLEYAPSRRTCDAPLRVVVIVVCFRVVIAGACLCRHPPL